MEGLIKGALLGVSVGDALGVPVEFKSRAELQANPVVDMIDYGTYNLPAGTWSDDSSLTFCLADTIAKGFDLYKLGQSFCNWRYKNLWTALPRGVFDIGITTEKAIERLRSGEQPDLAGEFEENSNGNGSLMRILPLAFYIRDMEVEERFLFTKKVSSLTHGHLRSVLACYYYLEFARKIMDGVDKFQAYRQLQTEIPDLSTRLAHNPSEIEKFERLLKNDIWLLNEEQINSSGYVVDSLEAAFWCLLTTSNYKDCVLKAVNLGRDTDTNAAIAGGLAGMIYGHHDIPSEWLNTLARKSDILDLAERVTQRLK